MAALAEVRRRAHELSEVPGADPQLAELIAELPGAATLAAARFFRAMDPQLSGWSEPIMTSIGPDRFDEVVRGCDAVAMLESEPVFSSVGQQCAWVASRGMTGPPARSGFEILGRRSASWQGKPAAGLFTSPATRLDPGLWHRYVRCFSAHINPPWETWLLAPARTARILHVDSSLAWCDLVESHPRSQGGRLTLDWAALADEYDAVHIGLRTVLATDGIGFDRSRASITPVTWSVPTTVWLRWSFDQVELFA